MDNNEYTSIVHEVGGKYQWKRKTHMALPLKVAGCTLNEQSMFILACVIPGSSRK